MCIDNSDIVYVVNELAELVSLNEGKRSFKTKAYNTAASAIADSHQDLSSLSNKELQAIAGIGKSVASKVTEYFETGSVAKLDELRIKFPPEYVRMSRISGLGASKLEKLRSELEIESLEDLKQAIDAEQIQTLPGFGVKAEQKIRSTLEKLETSPTQFPIAAAMEEATNIVSICQRYESTKQALVTGELRRVAETIGRVQVLVSAADPRKLAAELAKQFGAKKTDLKLSFPTTRLAIPAEIYLCSEPEFAITLLETTGPKDFFKSISLKVTNAESARTEAELFKKGTHLAPPAVRDIKSLRTHKSLVKLTDIKGDLHYHSDASGDGRSSLSEMVAASAERGLEYLAITDHAEDLTINGLNQKEMQANEVAIREVDKLYENLDVLYGAELNIGPDGGLDYSTEFRNTFDFTVASIHSHFDLSSKDQTLRLVKAISDPSVRAIGHLSGRKIGMRPGIEFDEDILIQALVKFDVALEINGALNRLDASVKVVEKAASQGVKFVVNTDSHHTSETVRMGYGVAVAQKAGLSADQILNAWPKEDFLSWLNKSRET